MSNFFFFLVWILQPVTFSAGGFEIDREARVTPRHMNGLSSVMQARLDDAFVLAIERVRTVPSCNALFPRGDGFARLVNTRYSSAPVWRERTVCRNTHAAFTHVGGRETWLCRNFTLLPRHRAAVVLIHEALHYAGWDEKPHDPEALDAGAINRLVSRVCDL